MALPFLILELDKERKFRFTIGDMAELLAWQRAKAGDGADGGKLSIEQVFAQAPRDMEILNKMLWLGLRHDNDDLKEADVGGIVHIGALPGIIDKVMSFMTSSDGKVTEKNVPRATTVRKRGTGAPPSARPAKSA